MAEIVDFDGEDQQRQRVRYPWEKWAAEPFPVILVQQGADFTITLRNFEMTLRVYASRNGLAIALQKDVLHDRMLFHFGPKGTRPGLPPMPPYRQQGPTSGPQCRVCSQALQADFTPHDVLGECFQRNPQDPRDTTLYLTHRNLRPITMTEILSGNVTITDEGPIVTK